MIMITIMDGFDFGLRPSPIGKQTAFVSAFAKLGKEIMVILVGDIINFVKLLITSNYGSISSRLLTVTGSIMAEEPLIKIKIYRKQYDKAIAQIAWLQALADTN